MWVLYLWIHTKVWLNGPKVGVMTSPYTHQRVVDDLGLPIGSVRRWFAQLRRWQYISTRRVNRGLEVTITKYVPNAGSLQPMQSSLFSASSAGAHQSAAAKRLGRPPERGRDDLGAHQSAAAFGSNEHTRALSRDDSLEDVARVPAGTTRFVELYEELRGVALTEAQREFITRSVDASDSLDEWRQSIQSCLAAGKPPADIKSVIDLYRTPTHRADTSPVPVWIEPCQKCVARSRRKFHALKAMLAQTRVKSVDQRPVISSVAAAPPRESYEAIQERLVTTGVLTELQIAEYRKRVPVSA